MIREQLLEQALRTLLDQIDFRVGACSMMDPVGACIPKEVFDLCDKALNVEGVK
jgi:hypothetical protein